MWHQCVDCNEKFDNAIVQNNLLEFFSDRFKYYMKERGIRSDIINASLNNNEINSISKVYRKSFALNKIVRSSNISTANVLRPLNILSLFKIRENILL